jgi:hypothetical protein
LVDRRQEWEDMLDEFLVKLYEKSLGEGITLVDRMEIGKELGWEKVRIDNVVNGLVKRDHVEESDTIGIKKIIITAEGREYLKDLGYV